MKGALLAALQGLQAAAEKYDVRESTVRRWCHEFGKQWINVSVSTIAELDEIDFVDRYRIAG